MKRDEAKRNLQVGIFLFLAIATLITAVFILGRTQSLFARKAVLYTSFENIGGLVVGAPVRLAGVDIGIVESISFDRDLRVKTVHVKLGVESRYLDRIREDSIARLTSKGLLGDMLINISVGDSGAPPLRSGGTLKAVEAEGLTEIITSVQDAIGGVHQLTNDVDERLKIVLTDQLARDLGRIAHATASVMEKVEKGDGLVHGLIYDPAYAARAKTILSGGSAVVQSAAQAAERLDRVMAEIEKGEGTIHGLIYRDDGGRLLRDGARAAASLAGLVGQVEHGRGTLHTLLYEEDLNNLIENLTVLSRTLREVGEEIKQGKGTVGALLKDPTVYEDLKTILGNVKRNRLLRALVRLTIENDHLKGVGKVEKQ